MSKLKKIFNIHISRKYTVKGSSNVKNIRSVAENYVFFQKNLPHHCGSKKYIMEVQGCAGPRRSS